VSDDLQQFSPELVLVCPELRSLSSYGPVYAAPVPRVAGDRYKEQPSIAEPLSPFGSVEVSVKVPVLALLAAGAVWDIAVRGVLVAGAIIAAITVVMLFSQ
jgi:hypothetical protein